MLYTIKKHLTAILLACFSALNMNGLAQEIEIGNYTFKDGAEYQGEMFRGKPYGKGKTTFKNGDKYEGEYVKGKRQGYGGYEFVDGERYEGEWYQDQQHGMGTFYFKNNPKEAQRFANKLMEHLRSEGVDLPNPKKNAKKVSVRHGDSKVEVLLPNGKDYFGLVVHYQGLIKTDGKEEFGWFESIESGVSSFKLSDSRE